MGLIAIEGMHFYAHHGFYKEEQIIGGQYKVDVYITTNFREAAETDELKQTIDYEIVYRIVTEEMKEKAKLIEHVAHKIIQKLRDEFSEIKKLKVRVSKINPPVKGTVEKVYVELEKEF